MSHDLYSLVHGFNRGHNPWEKFKHRDESRHRTQDEATFRLDSRDPTMTDALTTQTTEIIERFLGAGSSCVDSPIPRQRQLLKDFLDAACRGSPLASLPSSAPPTSYLDDVRRHSSPHDIAIVHDRNIHPKCVGMTQMPCSSCYKFSARMSLPDLCTHVNERVSYATHTLRKWLSLWP